jgi:hypothetical protein
LLFRRASSRFIFQVILILSARDFRKTIKAFETQGFGHKQQFFASSLQLSLSSASAISARVHPMRFHDVRFAQQNG